MQRCRIGASKISFVPDLARLALKSQTTKPYHQGGTASPPSRQVGVVASCFRLPFHPLSQSVSIYSSLQQIVQTTALPLFPHLCPQPSGICQPSDLCVLSSIYIAHYSKHVLFDYFAQASPPTQRSRSGRLVWPSPFLDPSSSPFDVPTQRYSSHFPSSFLQRLPNGQHSSTLH